MVSFRMLIAIATTATLALGGASLSNAQTKSPSHDETLPGLGRAMMHGAGMGSSEMMGQGMMAADMMGRSSCAIDGPIMHLMFAISDANDDGALSFEEITSIHKRIFERIDENKDQKVTLEEMQAFW